MNSYPSARREKRTKHISVFKQFYIEKAFLASGLITVSSLRANPFELSNGSRCEVQKTEGGKDGDEVDQECAVILDNIIEKNVVSYLNQKVFIFFNSIQRIVFKINKRYELD